MAQPPMPSRFSSLGKVKYDLHLHKNQPSSMEVSKETCTGGATGQAEIVGRTVVLREGACELRITFNRNYTRANVVENNCSDFHGASCGFEISNLRRQ